MRWVKAALWVASAGVLIGGVTAASFWHRWANTPLSVPADGALLQVRAGDTLRGLARRLADDGALRYPRLLEFLGRIEGADARLRIGEYHLMAGVLPAELLRLLQSGDTVRYLVTLPEGIRLIDAISLLGDADGIVSVVDGASDPRLLDLVAPATDPEGYFLPETYQYERGDTDLQILTQAHALMRQVINDEWSARQDDLPYGHPYDALIMASIIEKETGVPEERAQISGVFVRRLERGMRLQTDPTVIYGLGDAYDGNLRRSHLRDVSNPYNSYRHDGLPPGPIAMPGREAVRAALHPAPGDALYFVARGDGSHEFTATLAAHEDAVRRYQLNRRKDYRSSRETRQ